MRRDGRSLPRGGVRRVQRALGGPGRWKAVALLACVMALDSADCGVIGAIANDLLRAHRTYPADTATAKAGAALSARRNAQEAARQG